MTLDRRAFLVICSLAAAAPAVGASLPAVGEVPIVGNTLVGLQDAAVRKAMEGAVDAAVRQAVADSVYAASLPALAATLFPRAESFVTHYVIVGREVSDALYTVRLEVDLDLSLLRKRLTALGLLPGAGGAGSYRLLAEGVPVPLLREALSRLDVTLGEDASVTPRAFSPGVAEYRLLVKRPLSEVLLALAGPSASGPREAPVLSAVGDSDRVILRLLPPAGALEAYGQTVTFYRKAPRPGEPNPDDVRGTEAVPWRETEPDDTPAQALALPLEQSVLGSVDPADDRDFYRVELPPGTSGLTVVVASTGPGEFRPRARVFSAAGADPGSLVFAGRASQRGRALKGSFPLPPGVTAVLVSVEDDLARFASHFPYRMRVSASEREDTP